MPYIGLLVGGFPPKLLYSLVFWFKSYYDLVLLILHKLLILLVSLLDPNLHTTTMRACMIPFMMLRYADFSMCPSDFLINSIHRGVWTHWSIIMGWSTSLGTIWLLVSGLRWCLCLSGMLVFFWGFRFPPGSAQLSFWERTYLYPWLPGGWYIRPPEMWGSRWHQWGL